MLAGVAAGARSEGRMSDPSLATAAWNLAKYSYQYSKYQIKKELVQATCDGMKLYG